MTQSAELTLEEIRDLLSQVAALGGGGGGSGPYLRDYQRRATGHIVFGDVGDCTDIVFTDGAANTKSFPRGVQDSANGVWSEGGSATQSATNLAAAINGDQRPDPDVGDAQWGLKAIASGSQVWVFASDSNDYSISRTAGTEPSTLRTVATGENVVASLRGTIVHNYAVLDVDEASQEIFIPMPFRVGYLYMWQVTATDGSQKYVTDKLSWVAGGLGAGFRFAHVEFAGAGPHFAETDIVRILAQEELD